MTSTRSLDPEQLRTELNLAVAPLDPSPRSFNWLQDNVARRRRQQVVGRTTAALGTLGIAAVALVVLTNPLPGRDNDPVAPTRTPAIQPGVDGDIDGDGVRDLVEIGDRMPGTEKSIPILHVWTRRGGDQRMDLTSQPTGDRYALDGVVDVDGDRRAEIVLIVQSDGEVHSQLVRFVGNRLVLVRDESGPLKLAFGTDLPDQSESSTRGVKSWGCADADPGRPGREIVHTGVTIEGGVIVDRQTLVLALVGERVEVLSRDEHGKVLFTESPMELKARIECGSLDGER